MGIDDPPDVDDLAGSAYDAFISYSHAADDLLAPRLQSALQRFAKPWWKRRAMRVFRDQSSLAANPHLWASITEAMDGAEWFILLLSPDAAHSEWVNREIGYWLDNKSTDRILPVVTAGEFVWNGEGSAVPPALQGVFTDEPRWVDLRFARGEVQLDLRHAGFRNAVADVASAVRDIPKDELESEEVRQHRRTMRTVWTAGLVVVLLAIAATVGAVVAVRESNEAQAQRDEARRLAEAEAVASREAEIERDRANQLAEQEADARRRAEESAAEAEAERAEAERQRRIADARALTLQADKNTEVDPELSALLVIAAMQEYEAAGQAIPADTVTVLREAIAENRIAARYPGGEYVWVSPDGSLLVAPGASGGVDVRDPITGSFVASVASPDDLGDPRLVWSAPGAPEPYGLFDVDGLVHLRSLDLSTWAWRTDLGEPFPDTRFAVNQDRTLVALSAGGAVRILDASTGTELHTHPAAERTGVEFWDAGTLAFVGGSEGRLALLVMDARTATVRQMVPGISFQPIFLVPSTDGRRVALSTQDQIGVVDLETGQELWAADDLDRVSQAVWLEDDTQLMVAGEGDLRILDSASGEVLEEIAGNQGGAFYLQRVSGTELIASAGISDGLTLMLDLSDAAGNEAGFVSSPVFGPFHVSPVGAGERILAGAGPHFAVVDTASGDVLDEAQPSLDVLTNTYAFAVFSRTGEYWAATDDDGWAHLWSATRDAALYSAPDGWSVRGVSDDAEYVVISYDPDESVSLVHVADGTTVDLERGRGVFTADFSADGSMVIVNYEANVAATIYSVPDGEQLARFGDEDWREYWGLWVEFAPDGGSIIVGTLNGEIVALDAERLLAGVHVSEAERYRVAAHNNLILPGAVSLNSKLMASTTFDERVQLRDVATGALLGEFGTSAKAGVAFDETSTRLYVAEGFGVRIYTLDVDELRQIALDRLTRQMTPQECAEYQVAGCGVSDG